jgi:hypothetical protein
MDAALSEEGLAGSRFAASNMGKRLVNDKIMKRVLRWYVLKKQKLSDLLSPQATMHLKSSCGYI